MAEYINISTLFFEQLITITETGNWIDANDELILLETIENCMFYKSILNQILIISNTDQNLIQINILISVLIKIIDQKGDIFYADVKIFQLFLKHDFQYKINFLGNGDQFYKDFVIDNLESTPTNQVETSIKKTHNEYYQFFKNKDVPSLRYWLKFITEKIFLENNKPNFYKSFSYN